MLLEKEQIDGLKKIQLQILNAFIDVCVKLNLRYFIIGGTLIGAVRHKGFIPWDDDIDVAMMREDYEVFIEKAQQILPNKYFVQTIYTEKNVPFNFCKLRDSDTTLVEMGLQEFDINHGISIDIFPLDYYPEKAEDVKRFEKKRKRLSRIISSKRRIQEKKFSSILRLIVKKVLFCCISRQKAVLKRDVLYKSVQNSNIVANLSGAWGEKEIIRKECFNNITTLEFEGIKVSAPEKYDEWLRQVYGDYMRLPPKEKQIGHHHIQILDLSSSYLKYYSKRGDKK